MNRRSYLVAGCLTFSSLVAGCTSDGSAEPECHLMHEVVESSEDYGEVVETYKYEELSSDAQQVVEEAVTNGSYTTTDQNLEPTEFRYWDTTTVYNVTYQNKTHVLLTYTGEGCESQ
ncbi:hypothetical protein [Natronosalvus rutilus]|uniref:DUF7979 domain-containing protein n=1 Tax=Natronosalvus rutilus TaxID=2953753 RepID=A0A9E7NCZ4_9EURY|nr:hypothetical protein [Natronosalvus rutilus]UTF55635.1 hypothetical protein NGM29_19750 [Natronosalvus rutilus]